MQRADLVAELEQVLGETGFPAELLELEITESAAMSSVADSISNLERLRALGVTIWIDDFGTGYSSFNHLKLLPVHGINIDRSFIRDLGDDPAAALHDAAIVRAIVALGKGLELEVVAEGVETVAQQRFLVSLGCRLAQGLLFSRPLPAAELTELFRAGRNSNAGGMAVYPRLGAAGARAARPPAVTGELVAWAAKESCSVSHCDSPGPSGRCGHWVAAFPARVGRLGILGKPVGAEPGVASSSDSALLGGR